MLLFISSAVLCRSELDKSGVIVAANKLAKGLLNIDIRMVVLKDFKAMILMGHI
jgi:hypothetical protein